MKRKILAVIISALLCLRTGIVPAYAEDYVPYAVGNISIADAFGKYKTTADLVNFSKADSDSVTQISLDTPADSRYGNALKITENSPAKSTWYTVNWNAISGNELSGQIQANFSVYIDNTTGFREFAVYDGTKELSFLSFRSGKIMRVDPAKITEARTAFSTAATYAINTWYNVEFTYDIDGHAYYVAVRKAADNSLIAEETLDLDDAKNIGNITKIDGFGFQSRRDDEQASGPAVYIDNLSIKNIFEENTSELVITKSTPSSDAEEISPADIVVEFSKDITSVGKATVYENPDGENAEVYSGTGTDITLDGNKLTIPAASDINWGKTYAVMLEGVSDGTQNKNFVFRFTTAPQYVFSDIKISLTDTDTKINASVDGLENDGQGRSYKLLLCEFDKDTHILTNSAYKEFTLSDVKSTFTTPSIDYNAESYYEAYLWDDITAMNAELNKAVFGSEPFADASVGNTGFVTDPDTGVVTASGQGITGGRSTVLILKPGKAMSDISIDNLKDTVRYIKQFDNTDSDAFSFIPGTLITDLGKYGFALNGSFTPEAFMYYPPVYYTSLYEKINAANVDLKDIVGTYTDALSISAADLSYFTEEELPELNSLFVTERNNRFTPNAETGYYIDNISTFENLYKEVVGRSLAKKGLMEIAFTKYGDALKESTYKTYVIKSGFAAENIPAFYTLLSQVKGKSTLEEIESAYNEKTVLYAIKIAQNQIFVEDTITKTKSYLETLQWDLSDYEGLDNKSAVNEKLRGVGYETIALLKQDFDKYVSEQKIIEDGNQNNDPPHIDNDNSVGGGGGGGGGITIKPEKPIEPIEPVEPALPQSSFSDMENHTWAHSAVEYLSSKGIINGKGNNSFAPADAVTREEFIKIVVAAFSVSNQNADCSFDDVDKNAWYYESVSAAYSVGLINGQTDTVFGVGKPITREDMAVMIYRAAQKSGISFTDTQMTFDDAASVSDYAKEAVSAMSGYGVINGVGENKFAPKNNATRAEAAKMIYEMMVKGGMA